MHIQKIDRERNIFLDETGTEHQIPAGCQGMDVKEMQRHIDIASKFIENFIDTNGYGETVDI